MNKLQKIALTAVVALQVASPAFAQLSSAPKSTGPSGGQVLGDFEAWFASHQGAAIALGIVAVATVGYLVYGFIAKPSRK